MSQISTKFIKANAVTNPTLAQMTAHTYKGNNTGSTANAADITSTQLTADLNIFTNSLQGLTPSSGGGTSKFLRADATWVAGGTATPTASTFASWDTNSNLSVNNLLEGYTTTVTSGTTVTLTVASTYQQYFTGSSTQTLVLPATSTLVLGQSFTIVNNSTGSVTVQSSGTNNIQVMAAASQLVVTVVSTSLTTAAAWNAAYSTLNGAGSTSLTSLGIFAGRTAIGSGVTTISPTFSTAFASATGYAVTATLLNTTDSNPQFQPVTITSTSTTGFTATWNDPTFTANYILSWHAILLN